MIHIVTLIPSYIGIQYASNKINLCIPWVHWKDGYVGVLTFAVLSLLKIHRNHVQPQQIYLKIKFTNTTNS